MKLTVVCKICGKKISTVEKNEITKEDIQLYIDSSICPDDFVENLVPILDINGDPALDEDGNPLFKLVRVSEIVAVKILE